MTLDVTFTEGELRERLEKNKCDSHIIIELNDKFVCQNCPTEFTLVSTTDMQSLTDHNIRLVHEIVNLKARIEKRIEELDTGEDYGTCSNPCIRELKKLLEKK